MGTERIHSLDALRAFALLLGVVFHAALAYTLPPGDWAVGTDEPALLAQLFAFYSHSFRMEIFFLLAGFFASLVLAKRPLRHFVRDRAVRIVLVFVVALYPMKWMLNALWLIGGMHTGRLTLSPEAAALPLWQRVLSDSFDQRWLRALFGQTAHCIEGRIRGFIVWPAACGRLLHSPYSCCPCSE